MWDGSECDERERRSLRAPVIVPSRADKGGWEGIADKGGWDGDWAIADRVVCAGLYPVYMRAYARMRAGLPQGRIRREEMGGV